MKYDTCRDAYQIAMRDIRSCITPIGIIAGSHHFVDLWARDSLFACIGALAGGERAAAKTTIETFLRYQRTDGLIPYRILRSPTTIGKYFGHPTFFDKPKADFRSHQSGGIVPDGGLMTIIASRYYFAKTRDTTFLKTYYCQLKSAMHWYEKRFGDGLIREWFLCEWADAVLKVGHTLYTNILYWKALESMTLLAKKHGDTKQSSVYKHHMEKVAESIRKKFWNGTYFIDWIDYKKHTHLSSHANCLAIVLRFATQKESKLILRGLWSRTDAVWTLVTNDPKYPWWRIPFWSALAGMGAYHNCGCLWMQPGILFALALDRVGRHEEAKNRLLMIAQKIIDYAGVYEVYDRSGKPFRWLWYRSEGPFAWSAGLFILAYQLIIMKKHLFAYD